MYTTTVDFATSTRGIGSLEIKQCRRLTLGCEKNANQDALARNVVTNHSVDFETESAFMDLRNKSSYCGLSDDDLLTANDLPNLCRVLRNEKFGTSGRKAWVQMNVETHRRLITTTIPFPMPISVADRISSNKKEESEIFIRETEKLLRANVMNYINSGQLIDNLDLQTPDIDTLCLFCEENGQECVIPDGFWKFSLIHTNKCASSRHKIFCFGFPLIVMSCGGAGCDECCRVIEERVEDIDLSRGCQSSVCSNQSFDEGIVCDCCDSVFCSEECRQLHTHAVDALFSEQI